MKLWTIWYSPNYNYWLCTPINWLICLTTVISKTLIYNILKSTFRKTFYGETLFCSYMTVNVQFVTNPFKMHLERREGGLKLNSLWQDFGVCDKYISVVWTHLFSSAVQFQEGHMLIRSLVLWNSHRQKSQLLSWSYLIIQLTVLKGLFFPKLEKKWCITLLCLLQSFWEQSLWKSVSILPLHTIYIFVCLCWGF